MQVDFPIQCACGLENVVHEDMPRQRIIVECKCGTMLFKYECPNDHMAMEIDVSAGTFTRCRAWNQTVDDFMEASCICK